MLFSITLLSFAALSISGHLKRMKRGNTTNNVTNNKLKHTVNRGKPLHFYIHARHISYALQAHAFPESYIFAYVHKRHAKNKGLSLTMQTF